MKKSLLIFVLGLFIASCGNEEPATETTQEGNDVVIEKVVSPETYCYLFTEGTENQDTNIVKLIIDGENVTGEMKYLPWQKDASVGTLTGRKDGNTVTADWSYWQEGMETKEPVQFKIEGEKLLQQSAAYDGEKYFFPEDGGYNQQYKLVDCNVFPDRDY